MSIAGGLGAAVLRPNWTPRQLGADLLFDFDAERADKLTISGGLVEVWGCAITSVSASQAFGSAKPAYSATGFNGRPAIVFDGADDELTLNSIAGLPVGNTSAEIWALVDQQALAADATSRAIFTYGGSSAAAKRMFDRQVDGGVNRARFTAGAAMSSLHATQDFSGRHHVRAVFDTTGTLVYQDGVPGPPGATGAPGTSTTRGRIAANNAAAPANFWHGSFSRILITRPLGGGAAAKLAAYLNRKR